MARHRASKGLLVAPRSENNISDEVREKWLEDQNDKFVTETPANKIYYAIILNLLWPKSHGIPGPQVTEDEVRNAVNQHRLKIGEEPYKDPFRRMRELQGDEGFTCIIKEGVRYQMTSLDTSQKRPPRWQPKGKVWDKIREDFGFKCNHCGALEPHAKLSPDHRVPRLKGGAARDLKNFQPLCEQCNNLKSSACNGCDLNCYTCPWAFPETYKPVQVNDANRELIGRLAKKLGKDPSDVANEILTQFFNSKG